MDALRAKAAALEATNVGLEKVNADLLCKFLKVFMFLKNYQLLYLGQHKISAICYTRPLHSARHKRVHVITTYQVGSAVCNHLTWRVVTN